jgi:methylase of polypeptide subunit release factors
MKAIDKLPDIITANLPYVDMSWDWVSPEIKYEPALALYAEDGGLIYIKRLVDEVSEMRKKELEEATVSDVPSKFLILEADTSQHGIIIEYVRNHGFELLSKDEFIITLRY